MAQTQFGFLTREREQEIVERGTLAFKSQFHSFFLRREVQVRDWEDSIRTLKIQLYHSFRREGMSKTQANELTIGILKLIISQLALKEFAHIINPNESTEV